MHIKVCNMTDALQCIWWYVRFLIFKHPGCYTVGYSSRNSFWSSNGTSSLSQLVGGFWQNRLHFVFGTSLSNISQYLSWAVNTYWSPTVAWSVQTCFWSTNIITTTRPGDHSIPLLEGAQPFCLRPYRYNLAQKTEIETQIADMLEKGWI